MGGRLGVFIMVCAISQPALGATVAGSLSLAQTAGRQIPIGRMFLWPNTLIGIAVIQLLLLMSLTAVALIVRSAMRYRRCLVLNVGFADRIRRCIANGNLRQASDLAAAEPSLLGRLAKAALDESPRGFASMETAVVVAADTEAARMHRGLELLNVLGNLGPMLGLFGTVYGMIVAFQEMVAAGGRPNPGQLAAGISTSLVTTFWGLVVAVPSLAAYALLRNRVEGLVAEAVQLAAQIIEPLRAPPVARPVRPSLRVTAPVTVAVGTDL
jgi:biopolymer transport protein ExbB